MHYPLTRARKSEMARVAVVDGLMSYDLRCQACTRLVPRLVQAVRAAGLNSVSDRVLQFIKRVSAT